MDIRPLTPEFSVAPQIDPAELQAVADAGYRAVICNRPDGEEINQPAFAACEQAAKDAGLQIAWIPIVGGMIAPEALQEFKQALSSMPKPVLAYCRSGTRCTMLWAISQYGVLENDEIIRCATEAGYDVAPLLKQLDGA